MNTRFEDDEKSKMVQKAYVKSKIVKYKNDDIF